MSTEALKARLMRKALAHEVQVLLHITVCRNADIDPLPLPALLATDINLHVLP
jgi:hypothetical protein